MLWFMVVMACAGRGIPAARDVASPAQDLSAPPAATGGNVEVELLVIAQGGGCQLPNDISLQGVSGEFAFGVDVVRGQTYRIPCRKAQVVGNTPSPIPTACSEAELRARFDTCYLLTP